MVKGAEGHMHSEGLVYNIWLGNRRTEEVPA